MLTTVSVPYSTACIGKGGIPTTVLGHVQSAKEADHHLRAETTSLVWFSYFHTYVVASLLSFNSSCFCFVFSEWYGYHFPELIKIVSENATYCKLARFIGNRKELSEESLEPLEEITMDSAKAQAILEASRSSMGELHMSFPIHLT